MIRSFRGTDTEKVFRRQHSRRFSPELQRPAHRKGQHSIRVNDQWRICFRWETNGPHHVEICDYH